MRATIVLLMLLLIAALAAAAAGQSLEERLDEDEFLRGLAELHLPEVLERYIADHPTTDPVRRARFEMARRRVEARDPAATVDQRRAALGRLLAVRRALLETYPDDPRRALWWSDQAADLLFEVLPLEGDDLVALLGVPSEPQRQRVSRTVAQAYEAAEQAALEIHRSITALESTPGYTRDVMMQLRRRELATVHRDGRIPYLRGLATIMQAELNADDPATRRRLRLTGVELPAPIREGLRGPVAQRADLLTALAFSRLENFDRAHEAAARAQSVSPSDPLLALAARLVAIEADAGRRGAAAAEDALRRLGAEFTMSSHPFERLLIADRVFLLRVDDDPRGAVNAYADLLRMPEAEAGSERLVFDRLVRVGARLPEVGDLPPVVRIARADELARDDETRGRAIAELESIVDGVAGTRERRLALTVLAEAHERAGERTRAARRLVAAAKLAGSADDALPLLQRAVALAGAAWRDSTDDPDARAALGDALAALLPRVEGREAAPWQLLAGHLALAQRRLDEAEAAFAEVSPESDRWPQARFMLAVTARARAVAAGDPRVRRARFRTAMTVFEETALVLASHPAADPIQRVMVAIYTAEAHNELLESHRALEILERIELTQELPSSVIADALTARIDAYQALGRTSDALRDLERFVIAAPERMANVLPAIMAGLRAEIEALIAADRGEEARARARGELVPLAGILEQELARPTPAVDVEQVLWNVAEAYRLAGEHARALPHFDGLLQLRPDSAPYLFGQAECQYGLGGPKLQEAMVTYRRLTRAQDAIDPRLYWRAELRMLQILDAVQRETSAIGPRIRRLRHRDPTLGGEDLKRQFDALQRRHPG